MSESLNIRWTFLQSAAADIMRATLEEHRFDEHFHDTWAIGCVDRGVCTFTTAGRALAAEAGELVVIPPYVVHTGGTGDSRLVYRIAYVGETWVSSLSQLVLGAPQAVFSAIVIRDPPVARRLSAALSTSPMRDARRKALLTHALVDLVARHASPRLGAGVPRVPLEHAGKGDRLLRAVAGRSASRSAVTHRFTRRFGLSPMRYDRNLRCVSAKALLARGMPIVEAAQALGFSDQAHFTREFKRVHHITPGAYYRLVRMRDRADT